MTVVGLDNLASEPTALHLLVYGDQGWLMSRWLRVLDDEDSALAYLPVLEGKLRLLLRAEGRSGGRLAEGVAQVQAEPGGEVRVAVLLEAGAYADADDDGVPDVIDSCPDVANAEQGPCGPPTRR